MANIRVPYEQIVRAREGDENAIRTIIEHYTPRIRAMSTKRLFDQYGNVYKGVDEYMCRQFEAKLMMIILGFRILDK